MGLTKGKPDLFLKIITAIFLAEFRGVNRKVSQMLKIVDYYYNTLVQETTMKLILQTGQQLFRMDILQNFN